jgi:hypothetical protein
VFDNLFSILGPVFSAAILVSVVGIGAIFPMSQSCPRTQARFQRI